jgi:hypothetical protein
MFVYAVFGYMAKDMWMVGRCRFTVSKAVLKPPMVSVREARI